MNTKLRNYINERLQKLLVQKKERIEKADCYHEKCNFADEEWERTRALEISARISELEMLISKFIK